jgi:transcription elongation factor Elf1
MIDNIDKFKKKDDKKIEVKEEKKTENIFTICPGCQSNKEGILKIPAFDKMGVEGLCICKNCGIVFMERVYLDMVLEIIKARTTKPTDVSIIPQ